MSSHYFKEKSFHAPTLCDYCQKLLWGLHKQGLECKDCSYVVHRHCQTDAPKVCKPKGEVEDVFPPEDVRPERAADIITPTQLTTVDLHRTPTVATTISTASATSAASTTSSVEEKAKAPLRKRFTNQTKTQFSSVNELVNEIFVSSARQDIEKDKEKAKAQPPLNLFSTTPKNFAKFVERVGPVATFQDTVVQILTWENTTQSLCVMGVFTFFCLNPKLVFLIPQVVLLSFISKSYFSKIRERANTQASKPSKTPAVEDKSYSRNMQFIQNSMGMYCEAYDSVVSFYQQINWSDEKETSYILRLTFASTVITLILLYLFPWNYLILAAGLLAFLANSSLFRAIVTIITPMVLTRFHTTFALASKVLKYGRFDPGEDILDVVLFENQRWWAGLGWVTNMLSSERTSWSDETGEVPMEPKETFQLQRGQKWEDAEWSIINDWRESGADEEGWVYTDHYWKNPRAKPSFTSVTRRRMWVRAMSQKSDKSRKNSPEPASDPVETAIP
ncbi:Pex24p-domain-containing protein [Basidiobolus meristosporus CBS 931.73]|uniref:Pex24p-domain-containing protein n=1 Tax=Basidiobolus meristosporus CBS 931.73 TaxID=1314790 RepID=A0A1Y1ZC33_9FUNG|nr:Pex24p-domain-containing protein [Basidiobolus meristosporus CBS 931.73]|eukprot:ORY07830.1 Pex24p-domain-containing protein [Basidiobolus meristosporus CBS 931.73]